MNELKAKLVSLGLSEEMATKAIHTVAEFVKTKVPESFHSTIDSILDGNSSESSSGGLGSILGSLGGLFK